MGVGRSAKGAVAATLALVAGLLTVSVADAQVTGSLAQLPGTDACVSEDGTGGSCVDGVALLAARGVAISPDGKHVYVASGGSDAVSAFSRDTSTGKITQLAGTDGCVSETGSGGACVDGVALDNVFSVVVSPDGNHVYATSLDSDAVVAFSRNSTTGKLTQLAGVDGCVSRTGTGGSCADGAALDFAIGVAISPDGKHVYVSAGLSDAVAAFSRNATTGKLTQLAGTDGCVSETGSGGACVDGVALDNLRRLTVSPDGAHVYVAALDSDAVAIFSRNSISGKLTQLAGTDACVSETGTGGACTDGVGLDGVFDMSVSPSGDHVYVTAQVSDAVAIFDRNTTTGTLTQMAGTDGCVSDSGTGGSCVDGVALDGPRGVLVSPDGNYLYVSAFASDAVTAFTRNQATGRITQMSGTDACISLGGAGGCATGVALDFAGGMTIAPDGTSVYVTAELSNAVAAFRRTSPPAPGTTYYPLTVSKIGSGRVTGDVHLQIDCGDDCSTLLASHTYGLLTATPDEGSVFTGWSGDCLYIEDDGCTVHVTGPKHATATFEAAPAEPEPQPTPSSSPDPEPQPQSVPVSVTLRLSRADGMLVARGRVRSDETSCANAVSVEIHRLRGDRSVLKGTTTTGSDGRYRLELGTRRGVYVATTYDHSPSGSIDCLAAESQRTRVEQVSDPRSGR